MQRIAFVSWEAVEEFSQITPRNAPGSLRLGNDVVYQSQGGAGRCQDAAWCSLPVWLATQ